MKFRDSNKVAKIRGLASISRAASNIKSNIQSDKRFCSLPVVLAFSPEIDNPNRGQNICNIATRPGFEVSNTIRVLE